MTRESYLEVTFRHGRVVAAYYYLPRPPGQKSYRTEEIQPGILVDYSRGGRPIGIEITAPRPALRTEDEPGPEGTRAAGSEARGPGSAACRLAGVLFKLEFNYATRMASRSISGRTEGLSAPVMTRSTR